PQAAGSRRDTGSDENPRGRARGSTALIRLNFSPPGLLAMCKKILLVLVAVLGVALLPPDALGPRGGGGGGRGGGRGRAGVAAGVAAAGCLGPRADPAEAAACHDRKVDRKGGPPACRGQAASAVVEACRGHRAAGLAVA